MFNVDKLQPHKLIYGAFIVRLIYTYLSPRLRWLAQLQAVVSFGDVLRMEVPEAAWLRARGTLTDCLTCQDLWGFFGGGARIRH